MKKYIFELIILVLQTLLFYIYPMFGMYDPIGMVLLMLAITFLLGIILGLFSKKKIKYIFPVLYAILFLPTVYIYYNESAMIHSLWYLTVSLLGLFIAASIKNVFKKKVK